MVYRKKRTYRRKKRPYRRKKEPVTKIPSYARNRRQRNVPSNRVVTLTYADKVSFNYGTVSAGSVIWIRANGIWDPDPSIGGHSAMGWDEWRRFFREYTVVSSKITCTFMSSAQQVVPLVQGVLLEDGENFPSIPNPDEFREQTGCKWRMQQAISNGNPVTIKQYYNATKWHGVVDILDQDDQRQPFTGDPSGDNAVFFRIGSYIFDGSLPGNHTVWCSFRVEYRVVFNDIRTLSSSGLFLEREMAVGDRMKQIVAESHAFGKTIPDPGKEIKPESENDDLSDEDDDETESGDDTDSDALSDQPE